MFSRNAQNTAGGREKGGGLTRGTFAQKVPAGPGLPALLAAGASATNGGVKRTVLVTGANSGIGLDAATKLVRIRFLLCVV